MTSERKSVNISQILNILSPQAANESKDTESEDIVLSPGTEKILNQGKRLIKAAGDGDLEELKKEYSDTLLLRYLSRALSSALREKRENCVDFLLTRLPTLAFDWDNVLAAIEYDKKEVFQKCLKMIRLDTKQSLEIKRLAKEDWLAPQEQEQENDRKEGRRRRNRLAASSESNEKS